MAGRSTTFDNYSNPSAITSVISYLGSKREKNGRYTFTVIRIAIFDAAAFAFASFGLAGRELLLSARHHGNPHSSTACAQVEESGRAPGTARR